METDQVAVVRDRGPPLREPRQWQDADAQRGATLGLPSRDDELGVRATCRGNAVTIVRHPVLVPDQPLQLALEPAATLRGRIVIAGYAPGQMLIVLPPTPRR